jgi:flavin reductase (DIM6/NTAB) family NADH-FMN oxidoreductase RutF
MTAFKEFSARFAQSVCVLTHDNFGVKRSCTISSYSSVSASTDADIFSFSLAQNSFMAGIMQESSTVQITLLSHHQSSVARYYAGNRIDSDYFNIDDVVAESIAVVTGTITRSIPVGSSMLYLTEVENIVLVSVDSRPLVYRLRNFE